jgi:hypothetical protein
MNELLTETVESAICKFDLHSECASGEADAAVCAKCTADALEKSSEYRYRGTKRGGQKNDHPTKRNCAEQLLPLRSPFRMCQGRRGHPHMRTMRS